MRDSWNEPPWKEEPQNWRDYISEENLRYAEQNNGLGLPYEMMDVPDSAYQDGRVANKTIADLMRVKDMDKPFFLAVGFFKPHLPFNAPERYWDLYDPGTINLPYNYFRPENAPDAAIHNFGELRQYHKVTKEGPLDSEMAKTLIRGYYASISYTDTQIGKVLHALDTLGLKDNTIVILWGDHGWQLAEHTLWCKHSNFNLALRVPLIIRAPGYTHGGQTEALVEFIDIYPTLCDLANINLPDHLHGSSIKHIMKNPSESGKKVIYSRFHNGESIKTDRYLYSEWHNASKEIYARMLYDHVNDPDENINIAELPEMSEKVDELSAILKDEMEKAIKPIKQAAYDK
jgi:arylsulfatase A-like enzyme